MIKLLLVLIIADGSQAAVIHHAPFDTIEQCESAGRQQLGQEVAEGFVRAFACMNTKVEEGQ